MLDIEELVRLVAVHQVPPPAGLAKLVEDRPVGAETAELDVVQVLPGYAGVVHLAEGLLVSVVPVSQLLSAAKKGVRKTSNVRVKDNSILCCRPEGCVRDRGEDGVILAREPGDGDAQHLDVDHVLRHLRRLSAAPGHDLVLPPGLGPRHQHQRAEHH